MILPSGFVLTFSMVKFWTSQVQFSSYWSILLGSENEISHRLGSITKWISYSNGIPIEFTFKVNLSQVWGNHSLKFFNHSDILVSLSRISSSYYLIFVSSSSSAYLTFNPSFTTSFILCMFFISLFFSGKSSSQLLSFIVFLHLPQSTVL